MFIQYMNVLYNLLRRSGHKVTGIHNWAQFGGAMVTLIVIPAFLEMVMRGDAPDDEEATWVDWAKATAVRSVTYGMGTIPVVRDVGAFAMKQLTGIGYGGGLRVSPLTAPIESAIKAAKSLFNEDDDWWEFSKKASETMAFGFGFPLQFHTLAWNIVDWIQGDGPDGEWMELFDKKYARR